MTAAFRENWKRLSNKDAGKYTDGNDVDLVRFKDSNLLVTNSSGIQGQEVSTTAPTIGQVLQYDGTRYVPATLAGGSSTWSVVAKGLLAGATDGVVHTAVAGRSYVMVAFNADTSASNMSSGDEDLVILSEINNGSPTTTDTISGTINRSDIAIEVVTIGGAGSVGVQAFSNIGGGGGSDDMTLQYSRSTGQFSATHTQGVDATNGVYVLFEKS